MKYVIRIALKDIRETLRDKMTFLFLLVMPILFTMMFGLAFGGSPINPIQTIAFIDLDGSAVSTGLKGFLENSTDVRLESGGLEAFTGSPADLQEAVAGGEKWAAGVVVPAGYGASLEAGQPLKLAVYLDLNKSSGQAAQSAIRAAAQRTASAAAAARVAEQSTGGSFADGFSAAYAAWQVPPVQVALAADPKKASDEPLMPFSHTAPAMMIQFSLAGLLTAAQVMVQERKTHCMQRLLTTRVARPQILLGHYLAIFTMIFGQFILLVAFGQMVLKLDYLRQPLATVLMMLCTALFVSALGLLIGALAKTDDQAIIFAMVPMFLFSALGGAWMPLENTGEAFRAIGQYTPVAMALGGFKNIIARGLTFESVMLPAAALLGYAVLFFALAVWKFKFE